MNLVLCGMPGCGKTYLGSLVAHAWRCSFIDTDRQIEEVYEMLHGRRLSCREIRLQEGDSLFRSLESEVVHSLAEVQDSVIALGGGALRCNASIDLLKKRGRLLYLQAAPETLLARLKARQPLPSFLDPNAIEESFAELCSKRIPIFASCCDLILDVEGCDGDALIKSICSWRNGDGQ